MSSPIRPLSPKRDSLINSRSPSPNKSKTSTPRNPFVQTLPVKLPKLGVSLTPSRKSTALGFTIYEDKPEDHAKYHHTEYTAEVHDDKENILQPKVMALKQTSGLTGLRGTRSPLANLSISEYPGYLISDAAFTYQRRLDQVYQPKHYNNESRSVHKFNRLPSYITPPRNAMKKLLYQTIANEDDDVEKRLAVKLQNLMRRKRAMSVGVNKGKAHLVVKNKFKVAST